MSAIVLLDTSVYLNVLDVPGFNQHRQTVLDDFHKSIEQDDHFLLPLATVWETGNHIAHLPNGQQRRTFAQRLVDDVLRAFQGQTPYRATHFPERDEFEAWLKDFPDKAMCNKSSTKTTEGTSLADLSIIKEWERNCRLNPMSHVRIWSLDMDLSGYDRRP
ncbi:hypothetical protein [Lautropia mirabilis]|uniref:hypothetical protein n=1 Tax=Lautropia mirabilis TaxID=47671 RepID=UPI0028E9EA1C|nr:hypothetical protein [Lautropia mirabilis]